jgi:uncharacterized Zn-binding protein involved in type VI secretion
MLKLKKLFAIALNIYLLFGFFNIAFAQTTGQDYTKAGVSEQIRQYLCAPSSDQSAVINNQNTTTVGYGTNTAANGDLYTCINRLYKFAIVIGGVVGVFFIVIAGYLYMGAGGNDESITKAKDILTTTITSLVILFAGFILLKAINPDLIQFRSIQPPSVDLNRAGTLTFFNIGGITPSAGGAVIKGFDLSSYDPGNPAHVSTVQSIYNTILSKNLSSASDIKSYMDRIAPNGNPSATRSPISAENVQNTASKYNVDIILLLAIMQTESHFGAAGMGASTCNPGNVGNYTGKTSRNFCPNWQAGVDAIGNFLNNHRVTS